MSAARDVYTTVARLLAAPPKARPAMRPGKAPAPQLAGDVVAQVVHDRVLEPMRPHVPAVVRALENCGGCAHARRMLGSSQPSEAPKIV
jgi:hypothetical protein